MLCISWNIWVQGCDKQQVCVSRFYSYYVRESDNTMMLNKLVDIVWQFQSKTTCEMHICKSLFCKNPSGSSSLCLSLYSTSMSISCPSVYTYSQLQSKSSWLTVHWKLEPNEMPLHSSSFLRKLLIALE